MTNKFNLLVHELIHVTNTMSESEKIIAKNLHTFLMNEELAVTNNDISLDPTEREHCSYVLLPQEDSTKFSISRKLTLIRIDSFEAHRKVLQAIEKSLDFTQDSVDWFSSLRFGKNPLWEEFNSFVSTFLPFINKCGTSHCDIFKIGILDLSDGTFTRLVHQLGKSDTTNISDHIFDNVDNTLSIDCQKIIWSTVLWTLILSYDKAIRINILDSTWYSSMTYISDSCSISKIIEEEINDDRYLDLFVRHCKEHYNECNTNNQLSDTGFTHLADSEYMYYYYLLLQKHEEMKTIVINSII